MVLSVKRTNGHVKATVRCDSCNRIEQWHYKAEDFDDDLMLDGEMSIFHPANKHAKWFCTECYSMVHHDWHFSN